MKGGNDMQTSIFDFMMPEISIDKPIRLIELFGGYGSQAMALKRIGANVEHWKMSEWEIDADKSYNSVHNNKDFKNYARGKSREQLARKLYKRGISNDGSTPMPYSKIRKMSLEQLQKTYNSFCQNQNLGSITNIKGKQLNIVNTNKYEYIMTYSFPCTDLSLSGKQKGMKKGSGTRSGLLWEVERILTELRDEGRELPQILFMENVPQVIGAKNIEDFRDWEDFLKSLGYSNHLQILNAKNYGVAQNRERCFMLSFLGEYNYHFPEPIKLDKRLKDYLEKDVDEKYYIKNEKAKRLIDELIKSKTFKPDSIMIYDIPQTVLVRKHEIDNKKLCEFLRKHKANSNKTNVEIAENLNLPVTQVEHWFRMDDSFAVPDANEWNNLKKCLNIQSDEWDEKIMTFEEKLSVFEKGNRCYGSDGIAPTITSSSADEKIIEPKCLNSKGGRNGVKGLQPSVQDIVYDTDGIATAVTTSFMPNILEKNKKAKVIGSIYTENSEMFGTKLMPIAHTLKASKNDVAIIEKIKEPEPQIEVLGNYMKSNHDATRVVSPDGIAPTVRECHGSVTAVALEDDVDDAQINILGLLDIKGKDQVRHVYGVDGISPTLNTMQGGNKQPKIVESEVVSAAIRGRYDENGKVEQHLEQGSREYSNTITTVTKDNVVIEKNNKPERVGQISSDGSQCGMVYSDAGLFPTLSAGCHGYANPHVYTQYRIRKLTPVECGRLMGVNMDDIIRMIIADHRKADEYLQYMKDNGIEYEGKKQMDELSKIQGMSNSKLYKQYGNSIVVDVMCAMFRNLNIKGVENWNNYCKKQAKK